MPPFCFFLLFFFFLAQSILSSPNSIRTLMIVFQIYFLPPELICFVGVSSSMVWGFLSPVILVSSFISKSEVLSSHHNLFVILFMMCAACACPGDLGKYFGRPHVLIRFLPPALLLISFSREKSPKLSCWEVRSLDESVLKSK